MITGRINAAKRPVMTITVGGSTGQQQNVDVVVDTGFNGFLTLPPHLIITLLLIYDRTELLILGDNKSHIFYSYTGAEVVLDGQSYPVRVLMKEGHSLLGMALLEGHRLCLDITAGGEVRLEPLP